MVEKNFPQAIYGEILAEIESLLHALSNSGEDSKFDEYRQDAINKLDGVKNEVIENIKSLEEMPYRCPSFDKVNLPYQKYRYLLFSNYALVFVIDEENGNIYVDYILDTRKDYGWLFHEN